VRGSGALLRRAEHSTTLIWICQRQTEIALEKIMAWTTPTLVEICIGLEINGYLPAEF
jgi:coenzyme PQQ precursor peptide PqqA